MDHFARFLGRLNSGLSDKFQEQDVRALEQYLSSISPAAAKLITAQKVALATGIALEECDRLLARCLDIGLLHRRYALRCPKCDSRLKTIDGLGDMPAIHEGFCARCDETVSFDPAKVETDMEPLFALDPFHKTER